MPDDAAEIARIVAEQRATPEDLKAADAAPVADPAPDPIPEPDADPAPVVAAEGDADPTPDPDPKPAKVKKTATDFLTGRVGHLQQRLTQEQTERAALQARLDAAEALLNAR